MLGFPAHDEGDEAMTAAQSRWGTGANAEAIQAWDGPLYDRFVRFRHIVTTGLGAHGLDVGCGFGDTPQEIARLVGPDGEADGVDAAARFIETAAAEAAEAGVANARFAVADVETTPFEERFDYAFSRFGTMFFAN